MQDCIAGSHSIRLTWDAPNKKYEYFSVFYKENEANAKKHRTNVEGESTTLENLKSDTEYEITVRIVDGDDEWTHFKTTKSTIRSSALKLKDEAKFLGLVDEKLPIYQMNLIEDDTIPGIKRYTLGSNTTTQDLKEKTILLIGDTNSGKSTMVDAIFNYIVDVPFADGYRLKLSRKEKNTESNEIIWYRVMERENFKITSNINIIVINLQTISSGVKTHSIRILNEQVSVDAILFVMPVHCSLNKYHKLQFESFTESFAKKKYVNIYPVVTFDDNVKKDVHCVTELAASGLIRADYTLLRFNNSNLFHSNTEKVEQWIQRDDNLCLLFRELYRNSDKSNNKKGSFSNTITEKEYDTKSISNVYNSERTSYIHWFKCFKWLYHAFNPIIPAFGYFYMSELFKDRGKRKY